MTLTADSDDGDITIGTKATGNTTANTAFTQARWLVYSGDPRNDTIGAFKPTEDFKQYNTRLTAAIDGDVVTLSGFTSTTYDNKNAATGKTYNLL